MLTENAGNGSAVYVVWNGLRSPFYDRVLEARQKDINGFAPHLHSVSVTPNRSRRRIPPRGRIQCSDRHTGQRQNVPTPTICRNRPAESATLYLKQHRREGNPRFGGHQQSLSVVLQRRTLTYLEEVIAKGSHHAGNNVPISPHFGDADGCGMHACKSRHPSHSPQDAQRRLFFIAAAGLASACGLCLLGLGFRATASRR